MLTLALPPANIGALGAVCWVPALLAVQGRGGGLGFVTGMASCLVAARLAASGIFYAHRSFEADPGWIWVGFSLFGLVAGLALGIAGASVGEPTRERRPWVWAAWTLLAEGALLLYLPAHLALTYHESALALTFARIAGIWLVSYLLWAANFWIADRLKRRRYVPAACIALAATGAAWPFPKPIPAEGGVPIAMIQTSDSQIETLGKLNAEAKRYGAQFAVWPELSAIGIVRNGDTRPLEDLARRSDQVPFVTSYEEPAEPLPYNTATVFAPSGKSAGYRKRKPFAGERALHGAGDRAAFVSVLGHRAGIVICFDTCFPNVIRDAADGEGTSFILAPTLDPPTPHGVVPAIHAAYQPFRSAEIGLPIIRADTTAYSLATDGLGRPIASLQLGESKFAIAHVRPGRQWSSARWVGDGVLYCAGLLAVFGIVSALRQRQRN